MSNRPSPPQISPDPNGSDDGRQPSITPPNSDQPDVPVQRGSDASLGGSRSASSGSSRPPSSEQPDLNLSRMKRSPPPADDPDAKRIKAGSPPPAEDDEELLMPAPLAKRPDGGGQAGQNIALIANFLRLDPGKSIKELFQYDITVRKASAPEETGATERKERNVKAEEAERNWRVFDKLKSDMKHLFRGLAFAYDRQKILISLNPIHDLNNPKQPMNFEVHDVSTGANRRNSFKVRITLANRIKMSDVDGMLDRGLKGKTTFVHAIDLILRQHQYVRNQLIPAGRGFFDPSRPIALESDFRGPSGRVLMQGWFTAVRPIQMWNATGRSGSKNFQLSLNVDVTTSAFYEALNVVEYAFTVIGNNNINRWNDRDWKMVERAIKLVRVEARHTGFAMKLKGLARNETARSKKFEMRLPDDSTRQTNIADYFMEKYNMPLKYPDIPLAWSGPQAHARFFPLEVLWVCKGQRISNAHLKGKQTAQMIKVTAVKPEERLRKIQDSIRSSAVGTDEISKAFDLKLNLDLMKISGRVLNPSPIAYEGQGTVTPNRGAWEMRRNRFFMGATIKKWTVCVFDLENRGFDAAAVKYFCEQLAGFGAELGMTFPPPTEYKSLKDRMKMEQMFRYYQTQDIELVVCFIGNKGDPIYPEIKRGAEVDFGIMTQCISTRVLQNGQQPGPRTATLYQNICLKVNAKMGGINNSISPQDPIAQKYLCAKDDRSAILFVGADVTHPTPGSLGSPSIAALCANINTPPTKYEGYGEPQTGRMEIICDLKQMIKDRLKAYYKQSRMKPAKIVFYRDGVSEGQFREVMRKEVEVIRRACLEIEAGYSPPITFIVVQKRHHTRFFKQQIQDSRDANIPPGTVVDQGIVHPEEFDFYLCSHQGIQGTSKPTKYAVLRDDNKFSSDELQILTYHLCHLYFRCNRSVSIPAPVYYAHHIAFRDRFYLRDHMGFDSMSMISGSSGDREVDLTEAKKLTKLADGIKKRMYFV